MLRALQDLEGLNEQLQRGGAYAALLYAADTSRPEHRDLREKVELALTEIGNTVLFFDLEWLAVPDAAATRLMERSAPRRLPPLPAAGPAPAAAHALRARRSACQREGRHRARERLGRLFTELSALTFPVERDGESESAHAERDARAVPRARPELRRRAHDSLFDVLARQRAGADVHLRHARQDHLTMDRLRRTPTRWRPPPLERDRRRVPSTR